MVKNLEWETLDQRRKTADVTLMYKVVHYIAVHIQHHPTMAAITSTRHSHAWKFQTIRTNVNVYKYSFFPRTVILWNQLPPPVIAVPELDAFKVAVKRVF